MSDAEQRSCIPCGKAASPDDLTCVACGEASWGPPLTLTPSSPEDGSPDGDPESSPRKRRAK